MLAYEVYNSHLSLRLLLGLALVKAMVANFLRDLRRRLDMSQTQLANALGLSPQAIGGYERPDPSDATLERIKTFAVQQGHADLVLEHFPAQITRIIEPAPRGSGLDLHALLDEILQTGDATTRLTTENFLFIATQYLRKPR